MSQSELVAAGGDPLDTLRIRAFASLDLAGNAAFARRYLTFTDIIASGGLSAALAAAASAPCNPQPSYPGPDKMPEK
jgi:hypothetical protein